MKLLFERKIVVPCLLRKKKCLDWYIIDNLFCHCLFCFLFKFFRLFQSINHWLFYCLKILGQQRIQNLFKQCLEDICFKTTEMHILMDISLLQEECVEDTWSTLIAVLEVVFFYFVQCNKVQARYVFGCWIFGKLDRKRYVLYFLAFPFYIQNIPTLSIPTINLIAVYWKIFFFFPKTWSIRKVIQKHWALKGGAWASWLYPVCAMCMYCVTTGKLFVCTKRSIPCLLSHMLKAKFPVQGSS